MTDLCVIDDDEGVRSAICLLLRSAGYSASGFGSGAEFLDQATDPCSSCLILDVRMPGLSGLEVMERLSGRGPLPPIIVLTGHADVQLAVQAMKKGAMDFLEKPFSDDALLERVGSAMNRLRQRRVSDEAREQVMQAIAGLTPREREIMERIIKGHANKVIAIDLNISERTVEIHRGRVMKKLHARSVAELVQRTLQVQAT